MLAPMRRFGLGAPTDSRARRAPVARPARLVGCVEVVDEDRELISAEACDRVEVAQVRIEPVGDRDQQCIAGEVTETVVHVS